MDKWDRIIIGVWWVAFVIVVYWNYKAYVAFVAYSHYSNVLMYGGE